MNQDEQDAYTCLAQTGWVIDPKYANDKATAEKKLQADCKRCWSHRKNFPLWISAYIERWSSESSRAALASDQRAADQNLARDLG